MRVNDKELIMASFKPATIEGRINYKITNQGKSKHNFKEFWFKLTGNLFFYFSLNNFGGIKGNEPVGVIVLENCTVSYDEKGTEGMFSFFIQFNGDSDTYVFSCFNITQAQNWVIALRQASYEHLRIQQRILESKLESLGGKNIFKWNSTSSKSKYPEPTILSENGKSIGPKGNSFVSHMVNDSLTLVNTNSREPENQDLIKW